MNRNVIEFPKGPSARKPRGRRATSIRNRAPAARQGGRCARTWLIKAIPFGVIAAGWILAHVALAFRTDVDSLAVIWVVAGVLLGFGLGWIVREDVVEP